MIQGLTSQRGAGVSTLSSVVWMSLSSPTWRAFVAFSPCVFWLADSYHVVSTAPSIIAGLHYMSKHLFTKLLRWFEIIWWTTEWAFSSPFTYCQPTVNYDWHTIWILKIIPKCSSENRGEAQLMNYFFLYRGHVNSLWLFETAFSPLNFLIWILSYFSLNEQSMIEVLIIHISSYRIQVSYQGVLNIVWQFVCHRGFVQKYDYYLFSNFQVMWYPTV